MDPHMLDGLGALFMIMAVALCVSVPLGVWKFAELLAWALHHVSIN